MMQFERLPRETNRDFARRVIVSKIVSLSLKPGQLVSEKELADEMHLSRTPVREALIELSKTKIVEVLPQRGIRVSLIDFHNIEEARFLRLTLETAIMDLLCQVKDDAQFSGLEQNVRLQAFYLENNQMDHVSELDDAFHKELFRIVNMMQTYKLINEMSIHFNRVRTMSLFSVKGIKIVEDHKKILDAILKRDAECAKQHVAKHLSRYEVHKLAILETYPQEYFKHYPDE